MDLKTLNQLAAIQTVLSAVVAILSFIKFKERPLTTKLIGLLFLFSCLANTTSFALLFLHLAKYINIPGAVYDLSLIVIVGILYNHATKQKYARFFLVITVAYLVFGLVNLFLIQKTEISSYAKFLGSFIIIVYAVFFFFRLMIEMPATHIQHLPMFWFNSAFLLFHAGTIFLFAFTSYLTGELKNNLITYWGFHNGLSIVEHLIIITGLYIELRTPLKIK